MSTIIKNKSVVQNTEIADLEKRGVNRNSVLLMGLKVILYSLVLIGILYITLLDAQQPVLTDRYSEHGPTEYAQEFALLSSVLLLYLSTWLFPKQAVVAYLVGGFLGMAYIREFDSFLDRRVADGAWQVMAYSLAAITAFLVYRLRVTLWKRLNQFIQCRAFGIFITGMMIVFVYSRLVSDKLIWKAVMGEENYMYVVTRASEEAIELLGYTLVLIGIIEYLFYLKAAQTKKSQKQLRNKTIGNTNKVVFTGNN